MKRKALSGILAVLMACTVFFAPSCSILEQFFGTGGQQTQTPGEEEDKTPAHEHSYAETVKEPNCVDGGYTLHTCGCGDSYRDNEVPALGHKPVTKPGKAATCTEAGCTAGEYCDRCGEPLDGGTVLPAKGHSWSEWSVSGNIKTRKCPECGSVESQPVHTHTGRSDKPVATQAECAQCSSYYKITPRDGNGLYGYYDLFYDTNGEERQKLYYDMYTLCEQFCTSTQDVEGTPGKNSKGEDCIYYFAGNINLKEYNTITEADVYAVWKVFYLDNPAYYWLSNGCLLYQTSDGKPTRMPLNIDASYAAYQDRKTADNAVSRLKSDFEGVVTALDTEAAKARKIHDFIANRIDYSYTSENVPETAMWAHNIIGVAAATGGVCEAYAKTYAYLCNIYGLECILVTGKAKSNNSIEDHAWNYIKANGEWYAVDVTWDDQNVIIYRYMGVSESAISADHFPNTPQAAGVSYLYYLPDLSSKSIYYNQLSGKTV